MCSIGFIEKSLAGNYLFRTGMPKYENGVCFSSANQLFIFSTTQTYAIDGLHEYFPKVAAENGVTLPEDYYIVVISLLTQEREDVDVERVYYEAHPYEGMFLFGF